MRSRQLFWMLGAAGFLGCAPVESAPEPSPELGSAKSAIVNGFDATRGQEPWAVRITSTDSGNPYATHCTGTLIDPQWVLTAGHCVSGVDTAKLAVVLGDHDASIAEDTEQDRSVALAIVHASYTLNPVKFDIALLKLDEPAEISGSVQTAALASTTPTTEYAVGWGCVDAAKTPATILQKGQFTVRANTACGAPVATTEFCAGGSIPNVPGFATVCSGDSGGPLFTYETRRKVAGIASRVNTPFGSWPGIYTKVSSFIPWIKDKIGYDPQRDMRMTRSGTATDGFIQLYCNNSGENLWANHVVTGTELSMDCPDSWVWVDCSVSSANPARTIANLRLTLGSGALELSDNTPLRKNGWYWHAKGEKASYDCKIN